MQRRHHVQVDPSCIQGPEPCRKSYVPHVNYNSVINTAVTFSANQVADRLAVFASVLNIFASVALRVYSDAFRTLLAG